MRIDVAERRRRLAVRHGLAPGTESGGRPGSPADVARRLVAVHSTDPATVYLSLRARVAGQLSHGDIEEAMYERREIVRMLAMRRTVFVVPAESVPVVQVSTTDKIAREQRARTLKLLGETGAVADPATWLSDVERSVLTVLADLGRPASAAELSAAEPRLATRLELAVGKAYEARPTITSRVLLVLSAQGHIVRGRPIGSWLSQQYRWALTEHWIAGEGERSQHQPGITEADAKAELARQWLATFGPAPLTDLKWWSGWTMTQVRAAIAANRAVEVDTAGGAAFALPDDLATTADPGEWVALLPALDASVMGWSDRSWFLGPHGAALFDTTGNAGPTVWHNGRVVGGWAHRGDAEIAVRLFEDVGTQATELIEAEAAGLGGWLKAEAPGARVIPRFRTPTERDLSS